MNNTIIYKATFADDYIVMSKQLVVEEFETYFIVQNDNGSKCNINKNSSNIAFSAEDAILLLSNSYTSRIGSIEDTIIKKQNEILHLKAMIPELMHEQHRVDVRRERNIYV